MWKQRDKTDINKIVNSSLKKNVIIIQNTKKNTMKLI